MILVFWMLSFKPTFSLYSFIFIRRLYNSSLSALRVVSSAYLRLLIFLPAILIPACASFNLVFLMMYCAYKLNNQGEFSLIVYTCLKIRGETGADPKLDCCSIYWSEKGKYPPKELSVSEVWDNSGQGSSVHSLIYLHCKLPKVGLFYYTFWLYKWCTFSWNSLPSILCFQFFFKLNQSIASSRKPSLITVWYTPKVKESESEVSVVSDSLRPHGL